MVMDRVERQCSSVLRQAAAFCGPLQPQVHACALWSSRPSATVPFGTSTPDHHGS